MLAPAYRKTYLFSSKWLLRKKMVHFRAKRTCEECGTKQDLHVHHKTYDNIGNEPLKDLLLLCLGCHQKAHPGWSD